MSDANRGLLTTYIEEVWDNANPEAVRRFYAPGFCRHVAPGRPTIGVEEQVERLYGFREAFPDIRIEVVDVVTSDDRIAFRSVMTGTHLGPFAEIPPTGREVVVSLLDLIRVEDGKFAEQWGGPDMFDLVRQLTGG